MLAAMLVTASAWCLTSRMMLLDADASKTAPAIVTQPRVESPGLCTVEVSGSPKPSVQWYEQLSETLARRLTRETAPTMQLPQFQP
jgi:hypothetical protein